MVDIAKSPYFQFLINPSTLFIIAGMLVARYRDLDEPDQTAPVALFNATIAPLPLTSDMDDFAYKHRQSANHTVLETSYNLLDPVAALEMRLISFILQAHDNSSQWRLKFVDLPSFPKASSTFSARKANVLITDPQERVPIWVVVNLNTFVVESWTTGKQGMGTGRASEEEMLIAGEIALADVNVQERLHVLGGGKVHDVIPDVWDAGFVSSSPTARLTQAYFFGVRNVDGEPFAYPFNFVVYVELGKNRVRGIEDLPLHTDTKKKTFSSSGGAFMPKVMLPPNTIRSEVLYRLKGERPNNVQFSFQVSSSEELQR